jgi:tetratricopeptide (TPR) repeat protein
VPETVLCGRLAALKAAELLVETGLLPQHAYAFPHDLVRQVTYDAMLAPARVRLHREILGYLEAADEGQSEDRAATLCHHAVKAEEWEKSYRYAYRIAQKCVERSALADAVYYYEIAIDALDRLPISVAREERAIDLRLEARMAFNGFGRVDRWLNVAEEAGERAAAIGDNVRKVAAMAVRAGALNFYGTPRVAIEAGKEALRHAEELNDPGWLSYAEYGLGQAYFIAGRYREAEQMLERSYAQLTGPIPTDVAGNTVHGRLLICCMMKTAAHVMLGELPVAEFFQRCTLDLAGESQRPYDHVVAGYSNGMFLLYRGDLAEAQNRLEMTLSLARHNEVKLFIPVIALQLGLAYLELQLFELAYTVLMAAKTGAEGVGYTSIALRASAYLALALCESGESQAALEMAQGTWEAAQQQGFEGVEAESLFILATTLVLAPYRDNIQAMKFLQRSIVIATPIEANVTLMRSKALLNRLLREEGNVKIIDRGVSETTNMITTVSGHEHVNIMINIDLGAKI